MSLGANARQVLRFAICLLVAQALLALPASTKHRASRLRATKASSVSSLPTPGYRMVTSAGGMLAFGGASLSGSLNGTTPPSPVVSMASFPGGGGYWLLSKDGQVYSFGRASNYGGPSGAPVPMVAIAADPRGGYWVAAANGEVWGFGGAPELGSAVDPGGAIVGMASYPNGTGYWLVTSDGQVFAFGSAPELGSLPPGSTSNVIGMAVPPSGLGYWLATSTGQVYAFGDVPFAGSIPSKGLRASSPITSIASDPDGAGYWLASSTAEVYAFGQAPLRGPLGTGIELTHPVVAIVGAQGTSTSNLTGVFEGLDPPGPFPRGAAGFDVSFPECSGPMPGGHSIAVVGIENGYPYSTNPCLGTELQWAGYPLAVYLNTGPVPSPPPSQATSGPAGNCPSNSTCQGFNWGWNNAVYAVNALIQAGMPAQEPASWWLDVEMANGWGSDAAQNAAVIQGTIAALESVGLTVGLYSTTDMWDAITGGYVPSPELPEWYPMGTPGNPLSWCGPYSPFNGQNLQFAGGPIWIVQALGFANPPNDTNYDEDFAC